jgi:dephospho-CoA kinase
VSFKHGPKPVIGLIGAIGAGKSTAAKCFAARGGQVIDADALGHEALRQPEVVESLIKRWGERIRRPDGTLDRREIGRIVFADPEQRNALEAMVFPYIGKRTQQLIEAAQTNRDAAFVVLDAAVLLEAGWGDWVDRIVYVDAPRELRVARLAARSGWNETELAGREAAQLPSEMKKTRADSVVMNEADVVRLQEQIDALLARWRFPRAL